MAVKFQSTTKKQSRVEATQEDLSGRYILVAPTIGVLSVRDNTYRGFLYKDEIYESSFDTLEDAMTVRDERGGTSNLRVLKVT